MEKIIDKFMGKKCEDKISGFKGTCSSITQFLNGCIRISIQPSLDKDGKWQDDKWFDHQEVKIDKISEKVDVIPSNTGGPQTHTPPRMR